MIPNIILHNSISLDGSLSNFDVNMKLHYQIAGEYRPDAHLIGSTTIKSGIELYGEGVLKEEKEDLKKPQREKNLPYWIIVDTKGVLQGLLHMCRRFDLCKDIIVLTSDKTSKKYLSYLEKREYEYIKSGKNHIDITKSLKFLSEQYKIKKILVDSGRILGNILINKGLVNEISLLIHPIIVGKNSYNIFTDIKNNKKIFLHSSKLLDNEFIWLVYKTSV
jgi:2,5-diamino-6-(ribosylamino)-4(3H)-pyrimidinone 5'-phosphate reductase